MSAPKMTAEEYAAHLAQVRSVRGAVLAREVMDLIDDNITRWNQGNWRAEDNGPETAIEEFVEDPLNPACTTSFCFAGWIGALHRVKWAQDLSTPANASLEYIGDPDLCDCTGPMCVNPVHTLAVGSYAARMLELDRSDADALFDGDNSLDVLQAGVAAIETGGDVYTAVRSYYDEDEDDDDA